MTGSKSMKLSLIDAVIKLGANIDAIIVPGDLTSTATPDEFQGCTHIVEEIAQAIGVSYERIFYTFGNHDTDWRVSKLSDADSDQKNLGYLELASITASHFAKNPHDFVAGPVPGAGIVETPSFRLMIANSGFFSTHDQTYKHGKLGDKQLNWLISRLENDCTPDMWNLLILHHHPFNYPFPTPFADISFLEEGAELMEAIGKSHVDFVCHGHRHHVKLLTTMNDGWRSPVTFLCAGSVAVDADHRNEGELPNLFHVVTLKERSRESSAVGVVYSYQFTTDEGWTFVTPSSRVTVDAVQNFGSFSSAEKKEALATTIVRASLAEPDDKYCSLPRFGELPLELRCMTRKDLKELFHKIAAPLNSKLVNFYENDDTEVLLKRASNER